MSSRQIKWLILLIPTITIGLWEYVRHQFLLPYISMELGNWLAPVIVFVVTMLVVRKLLNRLEQMQEELQQARSMQAAMQEREHIARELHDGIAQSLFLMSVKMDQWERRSPGDGESEAIRQKLFEINEYVRQAIASLRYPPQPAAMPWKESIDQLLEQFSQEAGLPAELKWRVSEAAFAPKDKVALYAAIREALSNVQKHARASRVDVAAEPLEDGWIFRVIDDGIGFEGDPLRRKGSYGLKMLRDRAEEMGWRMKLERRDGRTIVELTNVKR